jgi:hypothetical protein
MSNNFRHVGLISLILPNARIINARRHPLDSCMSSYKMLFSRGQKFSYDLRELGEYYLQYDRLMSHWRDVLPGFCTRCRLRGARRRRRDPGTPHPRFLRAAVGTAVPDVPPEPARRAHRELGTGAAARSTRTGVHRWRDY